MVEKGWMTLERSDLCPVRGDHDANGRAGTHLSMLSTALPSAIPLETQKREGRSEHWVVFSPDGSTLTVDVAPTWVHLVRR